MKSVVDHAASDRGQCGQHVEIRMVGHSFNSASKYDRKEFGFGADKDPNKCDVRIDECGVHGGPGHVHDSLHKRGVMAIEMRYYVR